MIKIVNTETGEAIERELNAEELAQREIDDAADLAFQKVKEAQAKTKSALFEKLGITEDEAKLLLS
jgi:hypothetical protein